MQSPQKAWWDPVPEPAAPPGAVAGAEEEAKTTMPSLAKPFAAFGAAAGLFAILALGSFRDAAREVSPLTPMLATAAVGALVGVTLRSWRRLHSPMLAREAVVLWVAILTGIAGAVSGGVVGLTTWGVDGFARFAVGGAVVGLVFVPSCLVVFDAAKRAGRGRHGSLVAATDRRTVLSTVLAGIAFAGATQVPAVLSANVSNDLAPLLQVLLSLGVCLGATVGIVVLQRRDRSARASLESFVKDAAWLDRAPSDEAGEPVSPAAVDLGIGAERWTRTSDANYRSSGRTDVLVKGSIADATAAFDQCAQARHRALIVASCGLTAVTVSFALRLSVFL
jgi:multisubunit Na+/H+ antiporter MnhG subunit